MIQLKNRLRQILLSQWFILLLVIIILSIITTVINSKFISLNNIMTILEQSSILGLVAAGATILIISGNFDISVGAIMGLSTCVMAMLVNAGVNSFVAGIAGVVVCIVCCLINGLLSNIFKAPSFIVTLATTGVYTGIALLITKGVIQTIYGQFRFLSATKLLGFLPLLFVVSVLGYLAVHMILKYTQMGRRVYALGANERAAFLAGINVMKNKLLFFGLNGFFVGLASVLMLSRLSSALPSYGSGMELEAIGAVVIGGAPINGGKGNVIGTFFGVLLMGLISNALNMIRINAYFQDIASGLLIIIALGISALRVKLSKLQRS